MIESDWLKNELRKADVSFREDSVVVDGVHHAGVVITGDFMKLPKEIRHRLYSESKPIDWPEDRDYVEEMEQSHGTK